MDNTDKSSYVLHFHMVTLVLWFTLLYIHYSVFVFRLTSKKIYCKGIKNQRNFNFNLFFYKQQVFLFQALLGQGNTTPVILKSCEYCYANVSNCYANEICAVSVYREYIEVLKLCISKDQPPLKYKWHETWNHKNPKVKKKHAIESTPKWPPISYVKLLVSTIH